MLNFRLYDQSDGVCLRYILILDLIFLNIENNISKAGLIYMTKQLAMELAPDIRVNGIAPGVVKTKLSEMLWVNDEKLK